MLLLYAVALAALHMTPVIADFQVSIIIIYSEILDRIVNHGNENCSKAACTQIKYGH